MKAKYLLFIVLIIVNMFLQNSNCVAQGGAAINITGAEATPSALLDVSSTTQGAVVPRMTTAQRDNISVSCSCTPATGLFIYNTDCNNFNYYNGTSWQPMNTGGGNIPASAGSILGAASVCLGQSSVTYSIISVTNATSYVWSYTGTGFSIASGSGTNSITANFSAFATSGILSVYGTNACGNGSVSSGYSVTVNTPPIISNFSTPSATTVCADSASTVTVNSTSLGNGTYTVTYNLTGNNTATGSTASLTIASNTGTFSTSALANSGATTVTITSIQNSSGCSVAVSSGNTASITVTAIPSVSNFSTSATSPCIGSVSTVTVNSNSLGNGTFTVTYNLTGANTATGSTASLTISSNIGTFATSSLANSGATTVTITSIQNSSGCNATVSNGNTASITVNAIPSVSNFSTPSATTVCAGSASTVTVNSTSLDNGIFTVTYNLTGANTATGSTASLTISSNTGTFSTSALANSGTTTVTITSIQNSSGCSVTVSSGNTASITVTTLPATPTATVATEITSHQLAANWGNVSGATSYALDVVTDNSFGSGFVVNNVNVGNVLTYTVTGLTAGTTYYYRVRAVNSCTNGASSNTITATTFNLANSLLAYWKLDESSGNAIDIVGGHTGTNVNTVTFSAGKINNGGNFDRTIPNYFTPTNIGAIATGSLAVWVKGSFTTDNCDYGVFATTQWNASGQPFIYVRKRDSESKVARMGYDTYGNSAEIYATSDISTSNWNYCVWIWDVPNKKVTFYLNGNQIGSPTVTTMVTPVFNDLRLGNGIITGRSFAGQLDEVGLWSKALTQNEITALYNAGNGIQYPF